MGCCCSSQAGAGQPAKPALQFKTDGSHGRFPEKIGAIAFGGGGFKSVGCFWPVLYHIGLSRDLKELIDGCHFGVSSGGGWFFTHLLYNREAWRSLTSNKTADEFLLMYREYLEDILNSLKANELKDMSSLKTSVIQMAFGNKYMKDLLESQGFPLFNEHMVRWMAAYMVEDNGWKKLNDTLSHAQASTPNADLAATCDLANGILTHATTNFIDHTIHADNLEYYHVLNGASRDKHPMAQLPMSINARVSPTGMTCSMTLCQDDQSFHVKKGTENTKFGVGKFTVKWGKNEETMKVTKDDLERALQTAITKPHDLSAATTCYFSCFNHAFFTSYMGITSKAVKNILAQLEYNLLYKSFFQIDPIDPAGNTICPLRMVDGGPWDHTGIAMAVKGMQREGRAGDVLAITLYSLQSYENFHVMFTDFDNRGDHCGIAEPPYPRCFKGMPPTSCKAYGRYLQILDCTVETVDCPAFEITGGKTYRLFYVFLLPEKLKLFPFKVECVEEYVAWCTQALLELSQWDLARSDEDVKQV